MAGNVDFAPLTRSIQHSAINIMNVQQMNMVSLSFPRKRGNTEAHLQHPHEACSAEFVNNGGPPRSGQSHVCHRSTACILYSVIFHLGEL